MNKKSYKKKLIQQKLIGLVIILLCVFIVLIASTGTTPEDRDATIILLFGPLGLYLIFTKHIVIY